MNLYDFVLHENKIHKTRGNNRFINSINYDQQEVHKIVDIVDVLNFFGIIK
jgi:hypothetical protein